MTVAGFELGETTRALQSTPGVLTALLAGVPRAVQEARDGADGWSVWEVVAHMTWAEVDDWMPRLRLILDRGAAGTFQPFDREAGNQRYAAWPLARLLEEFGRLREENLRLLQGLNLGDADLRREGTHPTFGRVTVEQLLATWVTHDHAHLAQLARILTRHYGRHVGPWAAFFSLLKQAEV